MDTNALKKFAQSARNLLIDQVSSKLALVLDPASPARREHPDAMKKLDATIAAKGKGQVIEQVAYTWFNRFTALRFMDVNGYTNPRVVSPGDGATRPEILADALAGNLPDGAPPSVKALLEGRTPSNDPQAEAYRLLLVHACNQWHGPMPFLFEQIDDYSELLMPEDLLSPTSILARLRDAMADDACADVEIIGWLYQFYISEKKDQVFAGLKKNVKITAENIPAATQLFTPHWIVRYLVENSLGRLWLLNRPHSKLAARMDYYIAPEEPETDFLRITRPEEIRICDPACGSGHMLTYAFDLLYAIYEEEGYDPDSIPALILTHNLHGVEIDDRAGALAAFALTMKAYARLGRRKGVRMGVQPNICVLQDVRFTAAEMQDVAAVVGRDLFTAELRETCAQFEQAKNFGSLIVPKLCDPAEVAQVVRLKDFGGDLLLRDVQERMLKVLEMAEALSPKYHVVVANPPYMGGKGMNGKLGDWIKKTYPDSKSDLMTAFMQRATSLSFQAGYWSMINLPSWMFLSSFKKLRDHLLIDQSFSSLLHLGRGVFGSDFGSVAFVIKNSPARLGHVGIFRRLFDRHVQVRKVDEIEALFHKSREMDFKFKQEDFQKVPGAPIAYWLTSEMLSAFTDIISTGKIGHAKKGLTTGDNERFLRFWYEVSISSISRCAKDLLIKKHAPHVKGGERRKWFGNHMEVINYNKQSLLEMSKGAGYRPDGINYFGRAGVTWSDITSGGVSVRLFPEGFTFNNASPVAFFPENVSMIVSASLINSKLGNAFLSILNPTIHFNPGDFDNIPLLLNDKTNEATKNFPIVTSISKSDWDAYETSWDFTTLPLLAPEHRAETLEASYATLRAHWQGMTDEMQRLEEENNRIFIDAYGLQDELTPEVPLEEITLTCNPAYRYGGKATEAELETRLRADTMAEFLHYAVGCIFGRYSLDAPGLILANQGEGPAEYLARVPEPSFDVDADNVIPMLDGDWFADDITERFRKFLRVSFGEAKFPENLSFIEAALGKDIRKWFTRDFYDYHVRRYKKRPIYWMFASPKGSFQALIYMHRYRPDTVSVVLNDYLREFISKLQSERGRLEKLADDPSATQTQRTRALKDVAAVIKQIDELEEWEREVVFPLAQAKIEIDLDDGVKRNYPKFVPGLKPIKGLEAKEE
jgi:hypothetical protein